MSWADVWITPTQLAAEYHFPSVESARKWARRKNLSRIKLRDADGRLIAYSRSEVEKARRSRGPLPRLVDEKGAA